MRLSDGKQSQARGASTVSPEGQSYAGRIDVERAELRKLRRLGWRAVRTKTRQNSNASMQTEARRLLQRRVAEGRLGYGLDKG